MIVDYSKDSDKNIFKKWFTFDMENMLALKRRGLWWDEDEKKFFSKYSKSSEEIAQKIRDYFIRK